MADYMQAFIDIGGKLPTDRVAAFLVAITADGCQTDWGGPDVTTREDIIEQAEEHEQLRLYSDEASYGSFDSVEAFCREHALSYDRHSDAKYEHQAGWMRWRSGMEQPAWFYSDNEGKYYVDMELAEEALQLMEGLVGGMVLGDVAAQWKVTIQKLNEATGRNLRIHNLRPFKIEVEHDDQSN